VEAAAIVTALDAHGVRATVTGSFTAGFRAEAPGMVNVLVRQEDLARARQVLSDLAQEPDHPQWLDGDFGEAEPE
jgi:hypothetical protein